MNDMSLIKPTTSADDIARRTAAYNFLAAICHQLELTDTQYNDARDRYEAVSAWLAGSEDPILTNAYIYAHGSTALHTTNRPLGQDEHDVDLIAYLPGIGLNVPSATVKKVMGDRLRANGRYAPILEEKKRCWRLNYAGQFHMDITPSILNPNCTNGGELVPDKELRSWKPTHPRGYRELFLKRADMEPMFKFENAVMDGARAEIEEFPKKMIQKKVLHRVVQLLKRHRDIAFAGKDQSLAPLSIIITTLAAKSFEYCVSHHAHNTELDLLRDTIRLMYLFIQVSHEHGKPSWLIANETTNGENFAEKWNDESDRARAFYEWHKVATQDFDALADMEGRDVIVFHLAPVLGEGPVMAAMGHRIEAITSARKSNKLLIEPRVGLTVAASTAATSVKANTFYGE